MGLLLKGIVSRTASADAKKPVTKNFVLRKLTGPAHALDALREGSYVVQAGPWDHVVPDHHAHAELLTLLRRFCIQKSSGGRISIADDPKFGIFGAKQKR